MPDLSHLDAQNLANMQLNMVFGRRGLHTQPAASLLFNQARLIDHALREYESARAACDEYAAGQHSAYFRAQSHLEAFLLSLWRSLQYARTLQTLHRPESPDIPPIPNSDLPRRPDEERITRVRGAILHTEERVRAGEAEPHRCPDGRKREAEDKKTYGALVRKKKKKQGWWRARLRRQWTGGWRGPGGRGTLRVGL